MLVYLIKNTISGKQYVGQTVRTLDERWKRHGWKSTTGSRRMPISDAMGKYGKENFTISLLKTCDTLDDLNYWERWYVDNLNTWVPNGYNLKAGNGRGACSEELKQKIARANTGKVASIETKNKLSLSHLGVKHSLERNIAKSQYMKGRPLSAAAKANSIKSTVKAYTVIDPMGTVTTITNMAKFCRDFNYNKINFCKLVRGKLDSYRGWTRNAI